MPQDDVIHTLHVEVYHHLEALLPAHDNANDRLSDVVSTLERLEGVHLLFLPSEGVLKKNTLYVKIVGDTLHYGAINPSGKTKYDKIKHYALEPSFHGSQTLDELQSLLPALLAFTEKKGHTRKVEHASPERRFQELIFMFTTFIELLQEPDLDDKQCLRLSCYLPRILQLVDTSLPLIKRAHVRQFMQECDTLNSAIHAPRFQTLPAFVQHAVWYAMARFYYHYSVDLAFPAKKNALQQAIAYNQVALNRLNEPLSNELKKLHQLQSHLRQQLEVHLRWQSLIQGKVLKNWLRDNKAVPPSRQTITPAVFDFLVALVNTLWTGARINEVSVQQLWLQQCFDDYRLFWHKEENEENNPSHLTTLLIQQAEFPLAMTAPLILAMAHMAYCVGEETWRAWALEIYQYLRKQAPLTPNPFTATGINDKVMATLVPLREQGPSFPQWRNFATQRQQALQTLQTDLSQPSLSLTALGECVKTYSDATQALLLQMAAHCTACLGPPPCAMAWIGAGTFAQRGLSPYPEIDGFFLIEDEKHLSHPYFNAWQTLLDGQFMALGNPGIWNEQGQWVNLGLRRKKTFFRLDDAAASIWTAPGKLGRDVAEVFVARALGEDVFFQPVLCLLNSTLFYTSDPELAWQDHVQKALLDALAEPLPEQLPEQLPEKHPFAELKSLLPRPVEPDTPRRIYKYLAQQFTRWDFCDRDNDRDCLTTLQQSLSALATLQDYFPDWAWTHARPTVPELFAHFRQTPCVSVDFLDAFERAWLQLTQWQYGHAFVHPTSIHPIPLPDALNEFVDYYLRPFISVLPTWTTVFEQVDVPLRCLQHACQSAPPDKPFSSHVLPALRVWAYHAVRAPSRDYAAASFNAFYALPEEGRLDALLALAQEKAVWPNEHAKAAFMAALYHYPDKAGRRYQQVIDEQTWQDNLRAQFIATEFYPDNGLFEVWMDIPVLSPASNQPLIERVRLHPRIQAQLFDKRGRLKPKPDDARQCVLPIVINGTPFAWAKCYPEQSGTEYAVEQLAGIVSGGNLPHSQIVKLTVVQQGQPARPMAVQFLSHLPGRPLTATLQKPGHLETLPEQHEESPYRIDSQNFTEHLLRVLFVNPEDDKGNDYLVQEESTADGQRLYRLMRIDNERAFFNVKEKGSLFQRREVLQVKSILYCFTQMQEQEPLHQPTLEAFLNIDLDTALTRWLHLLQSEHTIYQQLFTPQEREIHFNHRTKKGPFPSFLTLFLSETVMQGLINRWELLRGAIARRLEQKKTITGHYLLASTQPQLLDDYGPALFEDFPDKNANAILQRFEHVAGRQYKNARQSIMPVMVVYSRSLRYKDLPTLLDLEAITRGDKDSPLKALKVLQDHQERRISELLAKLATNDGETHKKALQDYKILSPSQQRFVFSEYATQLTTHVSPQAQQNFLRAAMAWTPFVDLDLTPFTAAINETFLRELFTLRAQWNRNKEALLFLNLRGLPVTAGYELFALITKACPNLEVLDVSETLLETTASQGLVANKSRWPRLQQVKANGCANLQHWLIDAPVLQQLELEECPQLVQIETASDCLRLVSLKLSSMNPPLTDEILSKITLSSTSLEKLDLTGRHQSMQMVFFEKHPYLLNAGLPALSKPVLNKLDTALQEFWQKMAADNPAKGRRFLHQYCKNLYANHKKITTALLTALRRAVFDRDAATVLGKLGLTDKPIIDALLSALKNENAYRHGVHIAAATALENLGLADKKLIIDAHLSSLKSEDSSVRRAAAIALGKFGLADKPIIDALLSALNDGYFRVRVAAATALGKIGLTDKPILDALLSELKISIYPAVHIAAATALGKLGVGLTDNKPILDALLSILKVEYYFKIRIAAATALGKLDLTDNKLIVDTLLSALEDEDPAVRAAAAKALGKLRLMLMDKLILDRLLSVLIDKNVVVRIAAAIALGKLGFTGKLIVETFLSALKEKHFYVRATAAKALGKLGLADKPILDAILSALKDEDSFVRSAAAAALEQLGLTDNPILDALLSELMGKHYSIRFTAAIALGKIGLTDKPILDTLLSILKYEGPLDIGIHSDAFATLADLYTFTSQRIYNAFKIWQRQKEPNIKPAPPDVIQSRHPYNEFRLNRQSPSRSSIIVNPLPNAASQNIIAAKLTTLPLSIMPRPPAPLQSEHKPIPINAAPTFWAERHRKLVEQRQALKANKKRQSSPIRPYDPNLVYRPILNTSGGTAGRLHPKTANHEGAWALAIARNPKSDNPQHTFLIVESIEKGVCHIRRIDFGVERPNDKNVGMIMRGKAKITIEEKTEPYLKELSAKIQHTYYAWMITATQGKDLLKNIKQDQDANNLTYFLLGNPAYSSIIDDANKTHNCFSWCREHLRAIKVDNTDAFTSKLDLLITLPAVYLHK